MTTFTNSQDWLTQSTLLLQARPTTTRILTKYTHAPPSQRTLIRRRKRHELLSSRRSQKSKDKNTNQTTTDQDGDTAMAETAENKDKDDAAPRGMLVLKTQDPVSGTCLKYSTDKAAEVGRLIASLGRLGKGMAGLEMGSGEVRDEEEDKEKVDAAESQKQTAAQQQSQPQQAQQGQQGQGGGGGKKKKKGKR